MFRVLTKPPNSFPTPFLAWLAFTDDMPPLVDRPQPPLMMTMPMIVSPYSFDTDFTTIPYSPDSSMCPADMVTEPTPRFELISEEDAPRISATATDGVTAAAAAKPSHAKKRDAGHIPRPPNAFILFRSSFIKSESVPGNIEGNHSTLSKIIGIVWKTLPPAERQLWEKRAVQAQAEHRARYPDWRFRPGTNVDAIAKRKTKDKNKDRPPPRRRRNPNTRDKTLVNIASAAPTSGGGKEGDGNWGGGGGVGRAGGGRCKGKSRGIIQERRCAQIAELVARGVKGVALSSAVQAWDKESGISTATDGVFVSEQGMQDLGADADIASLGRGRKEMRGAKDSAEVEMKRETIKLTKTRSASTAQQPRFNAPFTPMLRRASSAPLVPDNGAVAHGAATMTTSVSPVPDLYPPPLSPASSVSYGSEVSFPDSDSMSVVSLPSSSLDVTSFSRSLFSLSFCFCFRSGPSYVRFCAFLATGKSLQLQYGQQRYWRARLRKPQRQCEHPLPRYGYRTGAWTRARTRTGAGTRVGVLSAGFLLLGLLELFVPL
ncbi:hypothetical protein DFH94DRAFT_229147 [Russula ochroleuca]|uniref:HMG box domain-containing protein n=1 Tax=Russula ochroleuca TaxID=152965 RepID=A0A9P5JYI3_9AGAM|nr:hypothetical protein DFH94DRAFT_229147 [Russula ochroleuca]